MDDLHRRLAAQVRALRAELAERRTDADAWQATIAAQQAELGRLRAERETQTARS